MELNKRIQELLADIHFYFDMDGTANEWDLNGDPYSEHYFLNRPPIKPVIDSMLLLNSLGFDVAFATSAFTTGPAMQEKREWANKIGCNEVPIIFIPYGENKDDYLSGSVRVLLDDHTPNVTKFSGYGVKFVNQINHKGGKWKGPTLSYKLNAKQIALEMLNFAISEAEKQAKSEIEKATQKEG